MELCTKHTLEAPSPLLRLSPKEFFREELFRIRFESEIGGDGVLERDKDKDLH